MAVPYQGSLAEAARWFAPALDRDEVPRAVLTATPHPVPSLATVRDAVGDLGGRCSGRVLLLTDRAIHVGSRPLWRRRVRATVSRYPLGSVTVALHGAALVVGGVAYYLNAGGYQLRPTLWMTPEMRMFLAASASLETAG